MILILILGVPLPPTTLTGSVAFHGATRGCEDCHDARGWRPARFDHARRTGYVLKGSHAALACGNCHSDDLSVAVPRSCDGCHRDPHRGELGLRCAGCHESESWVSRFDAKAHRRSAFPLAGAHAVIPCEECHADRFGVGFARAAAACKDCHSDDFAATGRTSIDHLRAGFGDDCESCHTPWRFSSAVFAQHETCFQIAAGEHRGLACESCHLSVQGLQVTGRCETFNAACTSCHEHDRPHTDAEHDGVPGYQYEDRKCYECHRFVAN